MPHDAMKVSFTLYNVVSLPVTLFVFVSPIAVIAFRSLPFFTTLMLLISVPTYAIGRWPIGDCTLLCLHLIATFSFLLNFVTDGRRNARNANQVIRRFMQDLLQTVSNRYVEFVSSEWRGTLSDFRLERQLSLLKRRIARWYFAHP